MFTRSFVDMDTLQKEPDISALYSKAYLPTRP